MRDLTNQNLAGVRGVSSSRFSQFDRAVLATVLALVALIFVTLLLGDRVGVTLTRTVPVGEAHSTDDVIIGFSEAMNRDTVTERIRIEPEVPGEFRWSGDQVIFQPETAFHPGTEYTVSLDSGAESRGGRLVLDSYTFSFSVQPPLVAYIAPADRIPQNVWIADPANPAETAQQVTFSTTGVSDFDVRPDGRQIAFSERRADTSTGEIRLLDLASGEVTQLTNCEDADCSNPVWRPDGNLLTYTRTDINSLMPNVGISPERIWLMDLGTNPPATQPLFADSQVLGYGPRWSGDGERLAFFDNSVPGIRIYDFTAETFSLIPSEHGSPGAISPDGTQLVFPELVLSEGRARSYLRLADINSESIEPLSNPEDNIDDDMAVWRPDGEMLAIGRRYWDERYTRGLQLYLMDPQTGETEPLVVDEQYANGFFSWDPSGTSLVIQRFPELSDEGTIDVSARPEIWTYNTETEELTQIVSNAFFPRWVP